jgi:MFS family permease
MKRSLSLMLFLHYFALGAIFPVLSLFLFRDLGLSGFETGFIIGGGALASILAPLLALPVADRVISSERLLFGLNLLSVILTLLMSQARDFLPLLFLYFALMMTKAPSFALTNSIAMKHLADPERDFASVRLFGTAGWIGGGLGFALIFQPLFPEFGYRACLWFSAVGSLALAVWVLILPSKPPAVRFSLRSLANLFQARYVKHLLNPSFLFYLWSSLVLSALDRYYFFGVSFQLSTYGITDFLFLPLLSLGQVLEILFMIRMGSWLKRFGFKPLFLLGALGQTARFAVLGLVGQGGNLGLVLVGIALHGFGFAFFFSNAFIYLDQITPPNLRAQGQLLYSFWIDGIAVMLGNFLAGWAAEFTLFPSQQRYNFGGFWIWAMLAAFSSLVVLAFSTYRPKKEVFSESAK